MGNAILTRKGVGGGGSNQIIVQDVNGAKYEYVDAVYRNDGTNNYAIQYWNLNNAATGTLLTNQAVMEYQYVIGGEKDVYEIYAPASDINPREHHFYQDKITAMTSAGIICYNTKQTLGFASYTTFNTSTSLKTVSNNGVALTIINNAANIRRVRYNAANLGYSNLTSPYAPASAIANTIYASDTHALFSIQNTANNGSRIYIQDFVNGGTEVNSSKAATRHQYLLADESYAYAYDTVSSIMYLYHIGNGVNFSSYSFTTKLIEQGIVKNSSYFYGIKNTAGVYTLEQFYKANGVLFNNITVTFVGEFQNRAFQVTNNEILVATNTAYSIYDHNLSLITNGTIPSPGVYQDGISTIYTNNSLLTVANLSNSISQTLKAVISIPTVNGTQGYVIKEIKK